MILKNKLLTAFLALSLLLIFCSIGCTEIVDEEKYYQLSLRRPLELWNSLINTWESEVKKEKTDSLRRKDSQEAYEKMERVVRYWDEIIPPKEYEDYHRWMRVAMGYELEILGFFKEYLEETNSEELKRLYNLGKELTVLKDKALLAAADAYPEE